MLKEKTFGGTLHFEVEKILGDILIALRWFSTGLKFNIKNEIEKRWKRQPELPTKSELELFMQVSNSLYND